MKNGQSEKLKSIRKSMILDELRNSDQADLEACKNDLMTKLAMSCDDSHEVANSIRDMFLPKLLKQEGFAKEEVPGDFKVKMTEYDDNFADESPEEEMLETEEVIDEPEEDGLGIDQEFDDMTEDSEVDANEIATIHITVPVDKLRDVEHALENVLGDNDAESTDQATNHEETEIQQGDNSMDKKSLEARAALRKTILAAMSDEDKEVSTVTRVDHFDYNKSEQYREEDEYNTKKGDLTDPDYPTLDYAENKIPNYSKTLPEGKPDLGLDKTLDAVNFDGGTPDDSENFSLAFDPFKVPAQGVDDLYNEFEIPSEGELNRKRTIASSEASSELEENILADALRHAGVEDEDLGKLTFAEAKELYRAIRLSAEEREHYSKDGKLPANFNLDFNKSMKSQEASEDAPDKTGNMEDKVRDESPKEIDPENEHTRDELYSSKKDTKDAYAQVLKKLMNPKHGDMEEKEAEDNSFDVEVKPMEVVSNKQQAEKQAELYKARLKTAYAMTHKLVTAGLLPESEVDAYAEGMLNDNLSVPAMIRQTKLSINMAEAQRDRFSASQGNVKTASSTGLSFNPQVRGVSADLSGAQDIQRALSALDWTNGKTNTGVEE